MQAITEYFKIKSFKGAGKTTGIKRHWNCAVGWRYERMQQRTVLWEQGDIVQVPESRRGGGAWRENWSIKENKMQLQQCSKGSLKKIMQNILPSIFCTHLFLFRVTGRRSLSPVVNGESALWTGHQSITRPHN